MNHAPRRFRFLAALAALFVASSCVDAPNAPEAPAAPLVLAPQISFAGVEAMSLAQQDALGNAFDRVNLFVLEVRRPNGELLAEVEIEVEPGRDQYDLPAEVRGAVAGETLRVTVIARQGAIELFRTREPIPVEVGAAAGGGQAIDVPLTYSGPGADAASLDVDPGHLVLGVGGQGDIDVAVRDDQGRIIGDAPVGFAAINAVAGVDGDGGVTGASEGMGGVEVSTVNGLSVDVPVYVAEGTLAFVRSGHVRVGPVAGGSSEDRTPTAGAAAQPSWSADGNDLFYVDRGSIHRAGGGVLVPGSFPEMSPNGSVLAFERDGRIHFANPDGSGVTEGPAGGAPVWASATEIVVEGNSIVRMRADGADPSTLFVRGAQPTIAPDGRVAYVDEGTLMVEGSPVAEGVTSRATWSPSGTWLVVAGADDLLLVPADGSGPPLGLGLGAATDPAFQPSGELLPPPVPALTGTAPDPLVPGRDVTLQGEGFDWIIPGNNTVLFPTPEGPVEAPVLGVDPDALRTRAPSRLATGEVVVRTRTGEATLGLTPQLGAISVSVKTPWDDPVPGITIQVLQDGETVADGTTDGDGQVGFAELPMGSYAVIMVFPETFAPVGPTAEGIDLAAEERTLDFQLRPRVARLEISPAELRTEVGTGGVVSVRGFDASGDELPSLGSVEWSQSGNSLQLTPDGDRVNAFAARPTAGAGTESLSASTDGVTASIPMTVTTFIEGTVTRPNAEGGRTGVADVALTLTSGAGEGEETMRAQAQEPVVVQTRQDGSFKFPDLFPGSYVVTPEVKTTPESAEFTLDDRTPAGVVDFLLAVAERRPGDVVIYKNYDPWFGDRKNGETLEAPPFDFVKGEDFFERPVSAMQSGIPSETSLIILGSASDGSSPVTDFNHPDAQENIEAWVAGGGWLLAHAGDNVGGNGYMVPGLSGIADDLNRCTGIDLTNPEDPINDLLVRGPDGELGTSDDLTESNVGNFSGCHDNHGSLEGILPPGALVLMVEEGGDRRPVYATYSYGAGRVVVTTLTLEFSGHNQQPLTNHLWWTIMGGAVAEGPALQGARALVDHEPGTRSDRIPERLRDGN